MTYITPKQVHTAISIDQFKKMDELAIQKYGLSIELMMENAGLQLARLVSQYATLQSTIHIGIGTGNNGGGGLVAARRLTAWGFRVNLDIPDANLKSLPARQFNRALASGAAVSPITNADIFVDAYFGFSQRLPLPEAYLDSINKANQHSALKISLDLPSGFKKETGEVIFLPDLILTLAAPKAELIESGFGPILQIADIGIPKKLYNHFGILQPPFQETGIVTYLFYKQESKT
jgi:NAD(P)H-hydrate epimerase